MSTTEQAVSLLFNVALLSLLLLAIPYLFLQLWRSADLMVARGKKENDDAGTKKPSQHHEQETVNNNTDETISAKDHVKGEEEKEQDNTIICCAACGLLLAEEGGGINLTTCDACDLNVHYCSDDCQREHRPKHEQACIKRAIELRTQLLYKVPPSTHLGDCPICLLPLPNEVEDSVMETCCSQWICAGCSYTNREREREGNLEQSCPFCRVRPPETNEEADERKMKRVEANDAVAICEVGKKFYHDGDYNTAFEYFVRATQLGGPGGADAHDNLSVMYQEGDGVEKDEDMKRYHLEEAAIAGHPKARYTLANFEGRRGNNELAVKHLIIAIHHGYYDAMKCLGRMYAAGVINKQGYGDCLRVYQNAVEKTKSPQRDAAVIARAEGRFQRKQMEDMEKLRLAKQNDAKMEAAFAVSLGRYRRQLREARESVRSANEKSSAKGKAKQQMQLKEAKTKEKEMTTKQPMKIEKNATKTKQPMKVETKTKQQSKAKKL